MYSCEKYRRDVFENDKNQNNQTIRNTEIKSIKASPLPWASMFSLLHTIAYYPILLVILASNVQKERCRAKHFQRTKTIHMVDNAQEKIASQQVKHLDVKGHA